MKLLALSLFIFLGFQNAWSQIPEVETPAETFQIVEEMPYLSSCKEARDIKQCSNQALMKAVDTELRYPKKAVQAQYEGLAVVRFVVNKEGRMQDIQLIRDPGAGLGEEAVRTLAQLSEELQWEAGKQRGRAVNVSLMLPVRFKLSKEDLLQNEKN